MAVVTMAGNEAQHKPVARQKLTPIGKFLRGVLDPLILPIVDEHWACASMIIIAIAVLVVISTGAVLNSVYPAGTPGFALQAPYNFLRGLGDSSSIFYSIELALALYAGVCGAYTLMDFWRPHVVRDNLMHQPREPGDFGGEGLGLWHALKTTVNASTILMPLYLFMAIFKGPCPYPAPWVEPCLSNCTVTLPEQAPSLLEFFVHFIFCMFINDFCGWYVHWMWHRHRALYKNIHAVHHEYKQPFATVSAHMHPHELLNFFILAFLPPVACRAHPFTAWIVIMVAIILGIEDHTGYESPVSFLLEKLSLGLFDNGHHDLHHQIISVNYQPFFGYLDRLCGTAAENAATEVGETVKG